MTPPFDAAKWVAAELAKAARYRGFLAELGLDGPLPTVAATRMVDMGRLARYVLDARAIDADLARRPAYKALTPDRQRALRAGLIRSVVDGVPDVRSAIPARLAAYRRP